MLVGWGHVVCVCGVSREGKPQSLRISPTTSTTLILRAGVCAWEERHCHAVPLSPCVYGTRAKVGKEGGEVKAKGKGHAHPPPFLLLL